MDTVCEESNDDYFVRRDAIAEFRAQERTLGDNFQQIEDNIVAMRLKAMGAARNAINMERVKLEVREKLVPVYQMVMKSLATSLCDIAPPVQLK